jgi:ATP-binding cassette subfamily F protein 3
MAARSPTQVKAEPEPVVAPPPSAPPKTKVPTGTARRRAETAEAALAKATELVAMIDRTLGDPATFADAAKAADLGRRRQAAQAALETAELEWIAAQEAYESLLR